MTLETSRKLSFDRSTIALFSLLLILYVPLLAYWVYGWLTKNISIEHEYFSHGLLGLPFAAYLCWHRRERWRHMPDTTNPTRQILGLSLLILGVSFYLSNLTDLINLSLFTLLIGFCIGLKGWPGLRLQAFPLLLLLLATPNEIPYLLTPYTLPLQSLIAGVAGFILTQLGMDVRVDQIYLFVNDRIVEVAPYCAGLKMLFTSFYVGLLLLYWTGQTSRQTIAYFYAGIIFISVTANIVRNTLLTFFHGTGQDAAFQWLHDGWGGDVYSTAMLGLIVLWLRSLEAWNAAAEDDFESDPENGCETEPQPGI
ncbi:MAG: cyanoexosortase B [Oscillatoriophycideae cyanobacterium NC_groundwater_1537_Pr4_S-0.65um_50_18]|nr:cyanoexosortase B [Oscillatoriophycideae cyanobacterium NC_groundwater_1537_Pr4_S-0.65um_50_18]